MSSKYLSLYEQIKNDIVSGIYKTGQKLPSKRTISEEHGVSVITAEHAYELLAEEGYIESRERSGYFVLFSEGDYFQGKQTKRESIREPVSVSPVKEAPGMAKGDAPLFSASLYAKTARRVLSRYEDELMEKSPAFGTVRLRSVLSDYLRRNRHIFVSPDQIIIGAGAEYLYGMIVKTLGRDKIYGLEYPGYHRIEEVYLHDGAAVDRLPLGEDGIKSKALWSSDATVLHITPYRSFPTGVRASAGKKREYLNWSEQKGGILIEDDFESEFTPLRKTEDTLFSLDEKGNVLYVNTFTKTIGPSVRIAYMLIPESRMEEFGRKVGFYSCPVPTLEQYIVAQLIEDGDFERHINRVRRKNRMKNE